jgi:hypothetical protein
MKSKICVYVIMYGTRELYPAALHLSITPTRVKRWSRASRPAFPEQTPCVGVWKFQVNTHREMKKDSHNYEKRGHTSHNCNFPILKIHHNYSKKVTIGGNLSHFPYEIPCRNVFLSLWLCRPQQLKALFLWENFASRKCVIFHLL